MKLEKLSIICATLTCLLLTSNALAEERQSFIRKVREGGFVSEIIQMKDGSYAYLAGRNITQVKDLSGAKISEVSLTFVDIPYSSFYQYANIHGMVETLNGFVLVGSAQEYGGYPKGIVINVNMDGRIVWKKVISTTLGIGFDSVVPADGGFIVTGWVSRYDRHPALMKFSSGGDIVWSSSFDKLSSYEYFLSTPATNGGVILARDLWNNEQSIGANVMKINDSGNVAWSVTVETKEFSVQSIIGLSDKGYMLVGKGSKPNKLTLLRLNVDGTFHSNAAYSLNVPDFDVYSLAQTPDDGIAIGGVLRKDTGASYDGFLLKINDRQELTLQKRLGFPKSKEYITSIIAKEDGSYLLFGSTYDGVSSTSDTLFVGLNSDGLTTCNFSHQLSASKVLFGDVNHISLKISKEDSFSVIQSESLKLTSKRLNRQISNACAK